MRFIVGPIPEDPTFSPEVGGWVRLREPRPSLLMTVAIPLGVLMAAAVGWAWSAIVRFDVPGDAFTFTITLPGLLAAAGILFGFVVLHELLHALPAMITGPRGAVVVGFWPRYLAPYVAYTGETPREVQLLSGSLPLLLLTVLPLGVALAVPGASLWMAGISVMNALGSSADLIMLALLARQVPRGALVRSNGSETWWRVDGHSRSGGGRVMSGGHVVAGPRTRSAFFALPRSVPGRTTALLFMAVLVAIAIMAVVVGPTGLAERDALAIFIVACVAAMAVVGIISIIAKRERSWAVIIPTLIGLALLLNELPQYLRNLL